MTSRSGSGLPTEPQRLPFRIEGRLIQPALNRIEFGAETLQVEPRIMRVLVCLASRPAEVFTREALFEVVWTDAVVCEEALTRTISELRRIFQDDPKNPRVIETIRKGGYRLIAPVILASTLDPAMPKPSPRDSIVEQKSRTGMRRGKLIGVAALVFVGLFSLSLWGSKWFKRSPVLTPHQWEVRPLTSFPGLEFFPALSPDGSMVAFSWAGEDPEEGDPLDLYVMRINNGSPVRLTSEPLCEYFPSWSPDGTEIAFSNEVADGFEICTVPVLGRSIRRLAKLDSPIIGLDWSPEGGTIAFASSDSSSAIPRIQMLSLTTLERRDLTTPPTHGAGDIDPAFSPDGRSVAFIRINELEEQNVCLVSLEGGAVGELEMGGERVSGIDWISQDEIVVSATSKSAYGIWRVSIDGERRTLLPIPSRPAQRPSIGRDAKHLVYEELSYACDIWCLELSEGGAVLQRSEPLIASTLRDFKPVYSPDGGSIAFLSDRSGSPEIWVADADGNRPRRLTDHGASQMMRPCWSPDGSRIAYSSNPDGVLSIYIASLESQIPRRLLPGGPHILSVWSHSGDTLYYLVDAAEGWEVWRIRPDGSGPEPIADAGCTIIDEAPDGDALFCLKSGEPGIWRVPLDRGEMSLVVAEELCRDWAEITVAQDGLYFIRRGREASTLGFYDYATGQADSLARLELYAASPSLSPDGSRLLYDCVGEIESDLMLVDFVR